MHASAPPTIPSRDELLRRAHAVAPVLRERSAAGEAQRRVPAETIADLAAAGLLRICQPARYGGYELGWDVLCEVSQVLARGCGSQAWVQHILCDHTQKVSTFALAAQHEVWGTNPDARISASFDPVGKAKPTAGGVIYSGRHGFSSGVDHAQWVICGGHIQHVDRPPERCFFLLPTSEIRIIDDWHVVGFAGTGSKSFETTDVFVPAHRILTGADADAGTGPGSAVNDSPISRLPRGGITATGFASITVGIGEGFLQEYYAYTRPRKSRGARVAEQMGIQISAGAASAEIEAAAMIYIDCARDAMRTLERGETITPQQKLRAKRNSAYANQLVLKAVTTLFNAAGGRALFTSNVMQRQYRDILAAASHHSMVWDANASEYGRLVLGVES
jgi:3-hydroxy-9,10-secoandrosta-1,3,5(10)-triene-9,17-dione monooxygenase